MLLVIVDKRENFAVIKLEGKLKAGVSATVDIFPKRYKEQVFKRVSELWEEREFVATNDYERLLDLANSINFKTKAVMEFLERVYLLPVAIDDLDDENEILEKLEKELLRFSTLEEFSTLEKFEEHYEEEEEEEEEEEKEKERYEEEEEEEDFDIIEGVEALTPLLERRRNEVKVQPSELDRFLKKPPQEIKKPAIEQEKEEGSDQDLFLFCFCFLIDLLQKRTGVATLSRIKPFSSSVFYQNLFISTVKQMFSVGEGFGLSEVLDAFLSEEKLSLLKEKTSLLIPNLSFINEEELKNRGEFVEYAICTFFKKGIYPETFIDKETFLKKKSALEEALKNFLTEKTSMLITLKNTHIPFTKANAEQSYQILSKIFLEEKNFAQLTQSPHVLMFLAKSITETLKIDLSHIEKWQKNLPYHTILKLIYSPS